MSIRVRRGEFVLLEQVVFIASWLVKLLLSKGYKVHGTVRDPSNEKNSHLKKLDEATENLQLFKADLLDYSAIEEAISGCEGVFHVASPVIISGISNPEVELIRPALVGTKNVLKACSETNVKRVVVVSSTAAVAINPDWPQGTIMDESCWSDEVFCRTTEGFERNQFSRNCESRERPIYDPLPSCCRLLL